MWELSRLTSRGGLSARRIFTYALAAIIAAFLWVILFVPTTHAVDATWNGASTISHDGADYYGPATDKTVNALGLPAGTHAYTYVEPAPTTTSATPDRHIHVIYFAPDIDTNVATNAKYKTYIYQGPDSYSNPTFPTDISIEQQSGSPSSTASSCDVGDGIGWMICPITNFLASGMDWVFEVLSGFLAVRPVETGQDNALFRAWTYMRNFANVAFVIAFLVIIYSQLTSLGINNYSIKKLLPRLIVAALLVNLSYYICAIAVDTSNVLAFSLQDLFIQMRNTLVGSEGNSWDLISWESITGFILSGGTVAAAGTIGLISTLSTYGVAGAIFLLLPALVTGLVAVLVALVIMAARQAIITILIIIAPLAFVAYLLPNTEKWFEKWRSLFMTMLILFPAFSLVFGGSQLASSIIIQNADSINIIILGMLVQVAPLFITPLLIRLSGKLLSTVAGFINNPNKGIIDRTRKFTDDHAENIKARRMATEARPHQFLRRNAQRVDHNRRRREQQRGAHTSLTDARYANSGDFNRINQQSLYATDLKNAGEGESALQYKNSKTITGRTQDIETRLRTLKLDDETVSITIDNQWEGSTTPRIVEQKLRLRTLTDRNVEIKGFHDRQYEIQKSVEYQATAEYGAMSPVMQGLVRDAQFTAERIAINAMGAQNAKHFQQGNVLRTITTNSVMRDIAGASIIDPNGADNAEATALSAIEKIEKENVSNAVTLLNHRAQANGETLTGYANNLLAETEAGTVVHSPTFIEAALEAQAADGGILAIEKARLSPAFDKAMVTRVIDRNASTLKSKGGVHLAINPDLDGATAADMNAARASELAGVSPGGIINFKGGWYNYVTANINNIIADGTDDDLRQAYITFRTALNRGDIRATLGDKLNQTYAIEAALARHFARAPTPRFPTDVV